MKRTLVLALLLATVAVLASSTATAGDSQNPAGHFLGALKPQGAGGAGDVNQAGIPNLTWHGGAVMHSTTVYSIYWAPAGYGYQASYGSTIDKYFRDVAADSGKTSNVYAVDTQYTDGSGAAAYASSFAGSLTDTNAFPASGCTDAPYTSVCLTDGQLQAELQGFIAANSLPTGMQAFAYNRSVLARIGNRDERKAWPGAHAADFKPAMMLCTSGQCSAPRRFMSSM